MNVQRPSYLIEGNDRRKRGESSPSRVGSSREEALRSIARDLLHRSQIWIVIAERPWWKLYLPARASERASSRQLTNVSAGKDVKRS